MSDPRSEHKPVDEFVLERTENPHPAMLAGALVARQQHRDLSVLAPGMPLSTAFISGYWHGYLQAMADATGCAPADIEAWMDRVG